MKRIFLLICVSALAYAQPESRDVYLFLLIGQSNMADRGVTTAFQSLPTQYAISPEVPWFGELRVPGAANLDLSLVKRFRFRERFNVDVRADASNATNTPRFDPPGTSLSNNGTFGVITSAGARRNFQLAFRMVF